MTTQAKHTPGPWEYVPSNEHHGPYITTAADGTYGDIADCYVMSQPSAFSTLNGGPSKPIPMQGENADANARLIGAAPDLLAALESALAWITVLTETSPANAEDMRETEHKRDYLCTELRGAIAKAHGEEG